MQTESRRERKKREMRESILGCALSRFSRDGFEATSLRSIADELDVSVPTLRNYFGSKDGLLVATLERMIEVVDHGVREVLDKGLTDTEEALQLALAINVSNPGLSRDVMAHVMRVAATEPGVKALVDRLSASLEDAVVYAQNEAGGRTDLGAGLLGQMLADLVLGAMIGWAQSPDIDSRSHTETVLRAALELAIPRHTAGEAPRAPETFEALALFEAAPQATRTRSELPGQILEVARRRFAADGVRETSIESIAEELSISPLTVFYHFGSKDGILAQIAIEFADVVEEAANEALVEGDAIDLRNGIAVIPGRVARLPDFGRKLTAELLRVMLTHPEAAAGSRRIHGAMARLVEAGQRRGLVRLDHGPLVLSRIVLDLSYGELLRWIQDPSRSVEVSAVNTMRMVQLLLAASIQPGPPPD